MDFTKIKLSNENIAFWKDAISQSNGLSEDEKWCCLYVLMKKSLENAVTDEQRVMIIKDNMTSNPCPFYKCEEDLTLDMDFEKFELIIDDIMPDDTIWGKEIALYGILNVSVENATTDEFIKRFLKYICKDNGDSYEDGVNFELFFMIYMAFSVFAERGIGIMQKSLNMFYEDMPIDIEDKEFEDDIAPTISTEFYENLIGIDDIKQRQILGCLGVKSSIFDALYKYLKAGDKASFLELLGEIDITRASKWAKGIYKIENFSIERIGPVVKEHINKYMISNPTHHEDTELEEQSFDVNALRIQMEPDITQKVIGIVQMKSSLEQFREKGWIAHICISELDIIESHLSPILKSCTLTASERDLLRSLNSDVDICAKKYINSAIPSNDDATEEAEEMQQEAVQSTTAHVDDQPELSRYKHLPIPFSSNYRGKMAALADKLCVSDPKFLEENSKEAFVYFMCGPEQHCMMKQNVEVVWRDTWKTHKYILSTLYQRIGTYTLPEGTVETI